MRVFDKAKWHAAQLGPGISSQQAYVHGGLLFAWLARRGLLEADLCREVDAGLHRGDRVGAIYDALADGVLHPEQLTGAGVSFLSAYIPDEEDDGPLGLAATFWDDLQALEAETGGPYTTPDDPTSLARFAARLDARFLEWRAAGSPSREEPEQRVYEHQPAPDARHPKLPAVDRLEVVLLGVPAPWPAWHRLAVWAPDTDAQRAAARQVRGEWVGFVPTDRPEVAAPDPGRPGALVWVEKVGEDGRLWMALPGLARIAVVGPVGDGRALVAIQREPRVQLGTELRAFLLAVDPTRRADGMQEPGVLADRVAWPSRRTSSDLRLLLAATDPFDRLKLALAAKGTR
jgi:hypothetical protein